MAVATKVQKHVHRYQQVDGQWFCSFGTCTHYIPNNIKRPMIGRQSVCHECGENFFLDSVNITQLKPKCQTCDEMNPVRQLVNSING